MERPGKPFLVIFMALAIVAALSLVPWSRVTHRVFKDYNLLADIMPDSLVADDGDAEPVDSLLETEVHYATARPVAGIDTAVIATQAPRVNGKVVIEDYSANGQGMAFFKKALSEASSRPVRVAVIGDSYIEGDLLTQDLRQLLQDDYGGSGVGYVPIQSQLAGFRTSINHKATGWEMRDLRKDTDERYRWLAGAYGVSSDNADTRYKGTTKTPHLDQWDRTELLLFSPVDGVIDITTDAGARPYTVKGGELSHIRIDGATKEVKIHSAIQGLVMLGVWLNGHNGVTVDNMSIRGDSGVSHRRLNAALSRDIAPYIDYDLIIVEYGINAMSASQKNYDHYSNILVDVINKVRECHPRASILLMGIGDRGQKHGSEVRSMATAPAMVEAQRQAARRAQVMFYDTREAMGGEGAVIDWRQRGLINADYIHLSRKGGSELAGLLNQAIKNKVSQ